jgi:2-C-methyl-D-erythritol 4-phosphate cytidylyltransferase
VVHDAARPLVTAELVRRCVDALDGVDCAFAAARVTDTVHEGGQLVDRSLDRSRLWAAQTPQVVRADVLRRALVGEGTDEASLVVAAGGSARPVEAPAENIKVTTPLDLRLAEALLAH